MTECKELQPSCAKGKTVGLFKTGKIELIASILSLGALSKMYFDCLGNCINDSDQDQVCDELDNCIDISNSDQEDIDEDAEGDACDYNDGIGIEELDEGSPQVIKIHFGEYT